MRFHTPYFIILALYTIIIITAPDDDLYEKNYF